LSLCGHGRSPYFISRYPDLPLPSSGDSAKNCLRARDFDPNYTEWHFDEAQAFTKDEVGVLETNLFSQTAPGFKNRALVVLVGYFGEAQQAKSLL
jgi:hypothetical protein